MTMFNWKPLFTLLMCLISRLAEASEQEIRCLNWQNSQQAEILIKYTVSEGPNSFESIQLKEIRVRGGMDHGIGASGPIQNSGHDYVDIFVSLPQGQSVAELRQHLHTQRKSQSFILTMGFLPHATYFIPRNLHGQLHLTARELDVRLEYQESSIFGYQVRVPLIRFYESPNWAWTSGSQPNDYYLPRFGMLLSQSSINRTLETCFQRMIQN